MIGLGIAAIFGFVAYILSWGFYVPDDLKSFYIIAAAGAMTGFSIGEVTSKHVQSALFRVVLIGSAFLVGVAAIIAYPIRVQAGAADVSHIVLLGVLIAVTFVSFSFLMPLAGVIIGDKFGGADAGNPPQ